MDSYMAIYSEGPIHLISFVVILQFLIFAFSLVVIFKLWMSIIELLRHKSTFRARLLARILGDTEMEGSVKNLLIKVIGIGLCGTVSVLGISVFAMSVIGNHVVS